MKKTYITPELDVIKINSHTLLSGSIAVSTVEAETDALGRDSDFDWDDEY